METKRRLTIDLDEYDAMRAQLKEYQCGKNRMAMAIEKITGKTDQQFLREYDRIIAAENENEARRMLKI